MFVLNNTDNKLWIKHKLSDSDICLLYRNPTTEERVAYSMERVKRVNNEVQFNFQETRIKYGEKIITGFRDGDFGVVKGDAVVPISSKVGSDNYFEDWKQIIKENAADVLELLAATVFDDALDITKEPEKIDKKKSETT